MTSGSAATRPTHPDRVIAYDAVGSGEGIRRFIDADRVREEKVDFGASDAALQDRRDRGGARRSDLVPLTAGSVALAYELPDVSGGSHAVRATPTPASSWARSRTGTHPADRAD